MVRSYRAGHYFGVLVFVTVSECRAFGHIPRDFSCSKELNAVRCISVCMCRQKVIGPLYGWVYEPNMWLLCI